MAAEVDATETNISAFIGKGGKLIVWQGGLGRGVERELHYRLHGADVESGRPGESHRLDAALRAAWRQPLWRRAERGPDHPLAVLGQWVTKGLAPDVLVATKVDASGAAEFSRPLDIYPAYARFTEKANAAGAKMASDFICTSP